MKLLALLALLCVSAFSQNPACHSPGGAIESTVSVSTTSATTLAAAVGGQDIHVCLIEFSAASSTTVKFQGSDGTTLAGPDAAVSTYSMQWDGQLTTRRAALGSSFQIQLGTVTTAVAVTIIYYLSPANSLRQ